MLPSIYGDFMYMYNIIPYNIDKLNHHVWLAKPPYLIYRYVYNLHHSEVGRCKGTFQENQE